MNLKRLQQTLIGRFVYFFSLYVIAKAGSALFVQLIRHNNLQDLNFSAILPVREMLIYGVPIVFVIALIRRPKVEP